MHKAKASLSLDPVGCLLGSSRFIYNVVFSPSLDFDFICSGLKMSWQDQQIFFFFPFFLRWCLLAKLVSTSLPAVYMEPLLFPSIIENFPKDFENTIQYNNHHATVLLTFVINVRTWRKITFK